MTQKRPALPSDLPPELAEYLNTVPRVSARDVVALKEAGARLDSDPIFQADFLKSLFVEKMIQALEERKQTKAGLAGVLKKSRQYIQKLFDESKRVNFTLETMCEVAHALGRRVHIFVCREDEEPVIGSRPLHSSVHPITPTPGFLVSAMAAHSVPSSTPPVLTGSDLTFAVYENTGQMDYAHTTNVRLYPSTALPS